MRPLPSQYHLDLHLLRLEHQGYTLVDQALSPEQLAPIRARFDELVKAHRDVPTAVHDPNIGTVDLNRLYELDPVFECLMDLPTVFPIARAAMQNDITLLGGPIGHYLPARAPSPMRWHRDGDYLRFTYLLDDLNPDGGGTTLMPGSHRSPDPPPDWFHAEGEEPRAIPGAAHLAGPAGTCMINWTQLWHTRPPNQTGRPRRLIWQVFKHAAQPLTSNGELRLSESYVEGQTDPQRRALMGLG